MEVGELEFEARWRQNHQTKFNSNTWHTAYLNTSRYPNLTTLALIVFNTRAFLMFAKLSIRHFKFLFWQISILANTYFWYVLTVQFEKITLGVLQSQTASALQGC